LVAVELVAQVLAVALEVLALLQEAVLALAMESALVS
jgi:hypothetical protein